MLVFYASDVLKHTGCVAAAGHSEPVANAPEEAASGSADAPAAGEQPEARPMYLCDVLPEKMKRVEAWLVTTEINYGGVLRKAKDTGALLMMEEEIDTLVSEVNRRDAAKLSPNDFIHICDNSMAEMGKELTNSERVVAAPKVIVVAGDQPGEMHKYTPYSPKGESYRMDPVCGDIQDALSQDRSNKKADRSAAASLLNRRYAAIADATKSWLDMTLDTEAMGFTNVVEAAIKESLRGHDGAKSDIMFSYLAFKNIAGHESRC